MVVLIILPIGLMSRKRTGASQKIKTKKEIHALKGFTAQTTQSSTGQLAQAEKNGDADSNEIQNASLLAGSFTLRLRELARARDLVGVEQLAKEMRVAGTKPTVTCYGVVIDAFAKAGDSAGAERWLADFMDAGLGNKPNTVLVNIAISACAKAGDSSRAEEWFERMSGLDVEPDELSYNAVINAHARSGNADRAEFWLEQMRKSGCQPNVISFSSVLHACAKSGDKSRAEAWLSRMEEEGVEPNAICYNVVIHACVKGGHQDRAVQWID